MAGQSAGSHTLGIAGGLTALFSLVTGLLILFVIPGSAYVSGIGLITLSLLFIAGLVVFFLDRFW